MSAGRRRHVPLRTCIICLDKQSKRHLIRLVRTPAGSIEIDPRGKLPGRGAYICSKESCVAGALQGGRLGRALRCHIAPDQLVELRPMLEEAAASVAQTGDERRSA